MTTAELDELVRRLEAKDDFRIWPQLLISWSRMLAGRLRDPLLGRDLLVGIARALVARPPP